MSNVNHALRLLHIIDAIRQCDGAVPRRLIWDADEHAEAIILDHNAWKERAERARAYLETQRLCGRLDAVLVTVAGEAAYEAALADDPPEVKP